VELEVVVGVDWFVGGAAQAAANSSPATITRIFFMTQLLNVFGRTGVVLFQSRRLVKAFGSSGYGSLSSNKITQKY
jgi:hypothetical protein